MAEGVFLSGERLFWTNEANWVKGKREIILPSPEAGTIISTDETTKVRGVSDGR